MKVEIYFYKDDIEAILDAGRIAMELGAGNDWTIIYSGRIKDDYLALANKKFPLPTDKKHIVIIQNNMI